MQGAAGTELDRTDESKPHPNNREHKGRSAQKQRLEKQGEREGGRPRRAGGRGREGGREAQARRRASEPGRRILTPALGELIFCHLWSWGDAVPGNSVCPVGHVDDPPETSK